MTPEKTPDAEYRIGDTDTRPWGSYTVTDVGTESGEEFCTKEIRVNPGQILSLQSHEHRREHWKVAAGVLTVVLDGARLTLKAGEDVNIPLGGIHCMANAGTAVCVVHEVQRGICREADIKRYVDAYGRGTEAPSDARVTKSIAVYRALLAELQGQGK